MNPYTTLGLTATASQDEIKKAYRKIAKKVHPDLNPGNKDAEKKFKDLSTAYEIVGDPDKRAKFDSGEIDETGNPRYHQPNPEQEKYSRQFYHETQKNGGRYSSAFEGVDPDFFSQFFGKMNNQNMAPKDVHYKMDVPFAEAVLGSEKEITLQDGKKLKIKIPPGIESGKKLRFKGVASQKDGTAGDVYIELNVTPSKIFTRNENNLEIDLPVTIYEAVLGADIVFPTLEKPVTLKIPPGSNTGTKLRLKGKGIVDTNNKNIRGDILVKLKVILPPTIDLDLQNAIKDHASKHPYNPRVNFEAEGAK